jgi:hypothetical protein
MHSEKMRTVLGSGFCVLNPVIKIRYLPLLVPHIPRLQHSIIPTGINGKLHPSGVPPKPGPLDPDIYSLTSLFLSKIYFYQIAEENQ